MSKVDWRGKGILEIGPGVGTDARHIIAWGARCTGIDISRSAVEITLRALRVFGLPGDVRQCSATDLEFENASSDVAYTFGVLHHIPDEARAVAEIHHLMKPGGNLLIIL